MRYASRFLLLTLGCLTLATSCVSSRRALRAMPWGTPQAGTMPDADRANAWPLLYHDAGMTSVLWPLADFDARGFAIRPLIAKDDADWSLLFPLSGWNTDDGTFWLIPAYWFPRHRGLFPLVDVDTKEQRAALLFFLGQYNYRRGEGWLGPGYWFDDAKGLFPLVHVGDGMAVFVLGAAGCNYRRGEGWLIPAYWFAQNKGVFPLFNFGERFSFVGPAWWRDRAFGLFPVFGWGEQCRYVGPAWWQADGEAGGLFPLLWIGPHSIDLFPLYRQYADGDRAHYLALYGVLGGRVRNGDASTSWVTPFYLRRRDGAASDTLLLPLAWVRQQPDYGFAVTPLGGAGWDAAGALRALNVLGPVFHHQRSADGRSHFTTALWPLYWGGAGPDAAWQLLFPLLYHAARPDGVTWLTPFYLRRRAGADTDTALFPLFWHRQQPDYSFAVTPLGGAGWDATGQRRVLNVLGPLYHHHESVDGRHRFTSFLWPLYWNAAGPDAAWQLLFPLLYHGTAGQAATWVAPFYLRRRAGADTDTALLPLFWHRARPDYGFAVTPVGGAGWDAAGLRSLNVLGPLFHHQRSSDGQTRFTLALWPLFSGAARPGESWQLLFPLLYHEVAGNARTWVTPFYLQRRAGPDADTALFPLFWHRARPGYGFAITPLGGAGWDQAGRLKVLNVLGPLYHHQESSDGARRLTTVLSPLYWQGRDDAAAWQLLLPLFFHRRAGDGSLLLTLPFAYATAGERLSLLSLGGPLAVYRSRRPDHAAFHFLWPLFTAERDGPRRRHGLLGLYQFERGPDRVALDYLLYLGEYERRGQYLAHRFLPFYDYASSPNHTEFDCLLWLGGYDRTGDTSSWRAFPLASGGGGPDAANFKLLFGGLSSYQRDGDRVHFSILQYFFRRERDGDEIRRDFFPGFTWDSGPDSGHFAFLWRVFNYQRRGDKTGGHVLFIPWGDRD